MQWHPISYDQDSQINSLGEMSATSILAPTFPEPHEPAGRPGSLDLLAFSSYVVDVLHHAGRSPELVAWPIADAAGTRGETHCLVFDARQIYPVTIVSLAYDTWLDSVHAETIRRFTEYGNAIPAITFFSLTVDGGRCVSCGGGFYNGNHLDQYARATQYKSDLHQWLRAASPRLWHGQDHRPEKDAFLAEAAANASGEVAVLDNEQLAATYERLLSARRAESRSGATDEDFARFAAAAGFELPEELKVVLRIADGCYLGAGYCDFMAVDEIVAAWAIDNSQFESSTLEYLTRDSKSVDEQTLAVQYTPRWIPITNERSPNKAGLDLLPGPNGKLGQVIYYGADESCFGVVVVADSLLDFFEQELAAPLVNFDVVPSEDELEGGEDEIEIVDESWISLKAYTERHKATS